MAPRRFLADSKQKAKERKQTTDKRKQQLEHAINYCELNNCRRAKAINAGICPLIKSRATIDRRLDNPDNQNIGRRNDSSILTSEEEKSLVRFIKNKNRAGSSTKRNSQTCL